MNFIAFRSFGRVNFGQEMGLDASLIGCLQTDNLRKIDGLVCHLCRSSCSSRLLLDHFFLARFFLNLFFLLGSISIHDRHEYHNNYIPPKLLVGMPEYPDQH